MGLELNREEPERPKNRALETVLKAGPLPSIDIAMIGAAAFHRNCQRPENTFFATSLYEIDRMIQEKTDQREESDEELVRKKLPRKYRAYQDVFSKAASDQLPPSRALDHKIQLEEEHSLGYCPLYNQSVDELKATKQYLVENLAKGFIVPSQAPFASPVLFVKKASGGLRFCIDYRKLNAITRKNRYPLPLIDETLTRISKAKIFTKLDIRQAFHRIRMHPESEDLTTFRTRYGSYKCKVLPFGLTNGPATFQHLMNDTLMEYLDDFCTAYLDDILIYSDNELEHEAQVKKVLERLRAAGLQADIKKCEFGVKRTKYLGFIVSTDGIQVDPEKVSTILQWNYPRSVKGVQSFLGFCNFYRRFIRNYGSIARSLTKLTRKHSTFVFDEICRKAFDELKARLASAPLLYHFDSERQSMLETDASDAVVAGVFSQLGPDGDWHPVAYFSKTMLPAECNYSIHDKEMLAIVRSFEQWRAELEGTPVPIQIFSDHKALEYFMTTKALTGRQARWADFLSRFSFQIMYRPGRTNKADPLTRRDQDTDRQQALQAESRSQTLLKPGQLDPKVVDDLQLEIQQLEATLAPVTNPNLDLIDRLLAQNRTAESLNTERTKGESTQQGWTIDNGLLQRYGRLAVPEEDNLRTELIREAHNQLSTAHPGRNKTLQLLKSRYYWSKMDSDVEQYIRNCHACKRSSVPRDKTPGLLKSLPIPERPWQHISVDFKEFPADKKGNNMILVFVDRLGKRPISVPCKKTTDAKELAQMYIQHVWKYYGPATTIVSDRGPQFISFFWNEFNSILGTKLKLSTAYHPQTDGQTENANQYIDQRLRPFVNHYQDNWSDLLPVIDFAAAALPHDSTGISSFMAELGYEPRMSFDWNRPAETDNFTARERILRMDARSLAERMQTVWELARTNMAKAQESQSRQANKHRREVDFGPGDSVWVSTKGWETDRPSRKLA
jgi:transposase InsO family protein